MFTGVTQVLAKVVRPGMKPVWTLTLRTHEVNGGVGIEIKNVLLSMSFEGALMSPIFCDGLTVIRSLWKLKADPDLYVLQNFGSQAIWIPEVGIRT